MRQEHLDGLRGWGAVIVLMYHASQIFGQYASIIYFPQDVIRTPPFQLFLLDGRLAVYVFFAISGFVLSIGFLESGSRRIVVSLALRRYLRLVIPILAYCILVFIFAKSIAPTLNQYASELGLGLTYSMRNTPSLWETVYFSLYGVFQIGEGYGFSPALWTMRGELFGSLALFAMLLIFGTSVWSRVAGYTALFAFGTYSAPDISLAVIAMTAGAIIADVSHSGWHKKFVDTKIANNFGMVLLIFSLVGAAFREPNDDQYLPYYGAAILYSATLISSVRKFLNADFSQFLGKISFPLYLIHFLVLYSLVPLLASVFLHNGALGFLIVVLTAVAAGWVFSPIESLAIQLSRRFSDLVFSLAFKARAWTESKVRRQQSSQSVGINK